VSGVVRLWIGVEALGSGGQVSGLEVGPVGAIWVCGFWVGIFLTVVGFGEHRMGVCGWCCGGRGGELGLGGGVLWVGCVEVLVWGVFGGAWRGVWVGGFGFGVCHSCSASR